MHYYGFHPAKFNYETKHLVRLEKAIYRELIDEYMTSESALTADFDVLAWRMSCHTEQERNALGTVLEHFFVKKKNKQGVEFYHHVRLDAEIRAYKWNKGGTGKNESGTDKEHNGTQAEQHGTEQGTDKERKERYLKERNHMIEVLLSLNVNVDKSIKMKELRALFAEHVQENRTQAEQHGTEQGTDKEHNGTQAEQKNDLIFDVKQEPVTINKEPVTKDYVNACEPTNEQTNAENILNLWRPTLKQVNDFLKISGLQELTQTQFEQLMPQFLAFYADEIENKRLSENKLFSKLVGWIKRTNLEKQPVVKPTTTEKTPSYDSRNVNKAWDEKPMPEIEEWSEERKAYEQAKSNAMLDELGFD